MTHVLVIDNYDSFVYNLVQYLGEMTDAVTVRRNDAISVAGVRSLDPDAVVVSPGPGTPEAAGISVPLFEETRLPTLGVCLGHQALCAAVGGTVGHAPDVVHGKPSRITHDAGGVFSGLPDPIEVGRYHSLCVAHHDLPSALSVTARTIASDVAAGGESTGGGLTDDHQRTDGTARPGNTERADGVVMAVRHERRPHVGVQFHPESVLTDTGKRLLWNFLREYADADPSNAPRSVSAAD